MSITSADNVHQALSASQLASDLEAEAAIAMSEALGFESSLPALEAAAVELLFGVTSRADQLSTLGETQEVCSYKSITMLQSA